MRSWRGRSALLFGTFSNQTPGFAGLFQFLVGCDRAFLLGDLGLRAPRAAHQLCVRSTSRISRLMWAASWAASSMRLIHLALSEPCWSWPSRYDAGMIVSMELLKSW